MSSEMDIELFVRAAETGRVDILLELGPGMDERLKESELKYSDFGAISGGGARYFARTVKRSDWHRWGFKEEERERLLSKMFRDAIKYKRTDLFDIYLGADIDFNSGLANFHMITNVLQSQLDDGYKAALTDELLRKGIDKVKSPERFVETALEAGAMRALTLLVAATNHDIHQNREQALRQAAARGQKDLARYLVEKHGADIELALSVARQDGFGGNWALLESVKDELRTLRDLQAQVAELKATVKELTAVVDTLRAPEQVLDKPVLRGPTTSPANSSSPHP